MRRLILIGAALLLLPAASWATFAPIVYIDDDFLPDPDMNGWTAYGNATMSNRPGNGFDLWNPTYRRADEQEGIVGLQEGGGGPRSFGIYKQFHDDLVPNGEKHIQVWLRMLSADWGFAPTPGALNVRIGKDPLGGTNSADPGIIWSQPYWGDWTQLEIVQPCVEGMETIFVQVDGWMNGYYQVLVDRVDVWQTPEPTGLCLIAFGALLLRRSRR